MPRFSAFTRFGHLAFSSKPAQSETIYRSIVAGLGGDGKNFRIQPGSRADATAYAQAMGFARARLTLQRAGNQKYAAQVTEMIPVREQEYGLVPGALDTMSQRRAALAQAKLLPLGNAQVVVDNALRALLGADFLAFRTTTKDELVTWPTSLGDQPQNLQVPTVPRKLFRLLGPVTGPGPQTVRMQQIAVPVSPGSTSNAPLVGDQLVVDPENDARTEVVTITAVAAPVAGQFDIAATYTSAHDGGCTATTQPYPMWASTKRHSLVVLTNAAASDPEKRRKVHEKLAKILRGVSTWSITDGAGGVTGGPFRVGVGRLGITTIGSVSF